MNPNQIRPLPNQHLSLASHYDFRIYCKQRKNLTRTLKVSVKEGYGTNRGTNRLSHAHSKEVNGRVMIIKAIKSLKMIKTVNLKDSKDLLTNPKRPNETLYIIKNLRRVESISTEDTLAINHRQTLNMWVVHAKKLKKIDYRPCELAVSTCSIMKKRLERAFVWMNQLKLKEFSVEVVMPILKNSFFLSQRYPKSLERLSLFYHFRRAWTLPAHNKVLDGSLSNLTQLKTLHLLITEKDMGLSLLLSIPDLSQLTTLEIQVNGLDDALDHISPFLDKLKKANNLKRLAISFNRPQNQLEKLFDAVKDCHLTEFGFSGILKEITQWNQMMLFLLGLQHLESLKLDLPRSKSLSSPSPPPELIQAIRRLLMKPIKIRSLVLILPDSRDLLSYEEIFEMLSDHAASFLKTLNLTFGDEYQSSPFQFPNIFERFLYSLKEIEILRLPKVAIKGELYLKPIVKWCSSSKNLRQLEFGRIIYIGSRKKFVNLVMEILSKRGLESFEYVSSEQVAQRIFEDVGNMEYIDLELVKQKNPAFEFCHQYRDKSGLERE